MIRARPKNLCGRKFLRIHLPITLSISIGVASVFVGSGFLQYANAAGAAESPPNWRLLEASIDDIHSALNSGKTTCRELVQRYLIRIEAYDKKGPALNAVQTVNPRALEEAGKLDAAFKKSGFVGPLHCVPVLVKDQVETSDMPTTYGSALFKDFISERDATIVTKMKRAGAIVLAKTNMGEFAAGYVGSAFGFIRNAYAPDRNPSGSSGGTASGIAANYAAVGIGEDTAGSIRGPAAVSNLVGLRPTVPLVSRFGMMPSAPTRDTLGPITRTVRDAAILLDVLAGYDPKDPVTAYSVGHVPKSYTAFLVKDGLQGARLGVIREPMDSKTKPTSEDYLKVKAAIDKAIGDLKALGAEVADPVTIPDLKNLIQKTGLSRYETEPATDRYLADHPNTAVDSLRYIVLSDKVAPSRRTGLMVSIGKTTDDLVYLQLEKERERLRQAVLKVMADNKLDALVYATFDHQTTVIPPDPLTKPEKVSSPGNNRLLSPALAFPALTVPAGFTSDKLPVGLEFLGRPFDEGALFKLGYSYEQGTHHRMPPSTTPALPGEP